MLTPSPIKPRANSPSAIRNGQYSQRRARLTQKCHGRDRHQQRHLRREQHLRPGEPALIVGAAEKRRRGADQRDAGDRRDAESSDRRKQCSCSLPSVFMISQVAPSSA